MKYYKTQNEIRAIGQEGDIDGDQSKLVQKDWIEISYEEMMEITNPLKEPEQIKVKTITLRQARLYLLSIELLDDLENIISQNRAYQIEWEYANQIERESPLVKILGQTLNLDDTAIDNMFMEASKI